MVRSPQTTRILLAGLATLGLTGAVALSVRDGGLWQAEPIPAPEPPATAAAPEEPRPGAERQTGDAGARPSFDIVRVTPDGAALVAGRAAPGARVRIVADDTEIASVDTDPDGSFVAIFDAEPTTEPRALTLDAETPDGRRTASDEAVVLLPSAPRAVPDDGEADAGPEDAPGDATFSPASGAADDAEPEVAATAILRPDAVEARPSTVAAGPRQVSLASISYTGEGAVTLTGAGTAGTRLRAYIDDALADEAAVAADGTWSLELADVAAGASTRSPPTAACSAGWRRRSSATSRRCPARAPAAVAPASRSPCNPAATSGQSPACTMVRACATPRSSPRTAT